MEYDLFAIKVEINFLAKAVTVHTFPRKLKLWEIPLNLDFTLCTIRINNSLLQLCSKNVKKWCYEKCHYTVYICDKIFFFSNRAATKWPDAE